MNAYTQSMKQEDLTGKTIAILCGSGVEKLELTEPRKALQDAGAKTILINPDGKSPIVSWDMNKWSDSFQPNMALQPEAAEAAEKGMFDALHLPGGPLNADVLRANAFAIFWIKEFFWKRNKPIAALCHAPWLLVEADILKGKKVTSYPVIATDLRNAGATWVNAAVITDQNIVTGRHPADTPEFNKAMINLFSTWNSGAKKT